MQLETRSSSNQYTKPTGSPSAGLFHAWRTAIAFSDYSLSASLNNVIAGISLAEGMARGDVNNAFRQIMADAKLVGDRLETLTDVNGKFSDADNMQGVAADLGAGTARLFGCYGDSTMWGARASNVNLQTASPPPLQLQNFVNNFNGNTALTCSNFGISGTTATQMIAGTDGSGLTFDARMAASSANVVFCNHGVNDANGTFATTAAAYRIALMSFVTSARKYNKIPVLVTPFPTSLVGGFGSRARVEATAKFAQVMREVAQNLSVILVDQFDMMNGRIAQGTDPLALFPDGVHADDAGAYIMAGNNLAEAVFGQGVATFTRAGQIIGASRGCVRASNEITYRNTGSKAGASITTATGGTQTLRVVFKVASPNMDITLGSLCYSSAENSYTGNLDGLISLSDIRQFRLGYADPFLQDVETTIFRNAPIGMHILILTATAGGAATFSFLRSRAVQAPARVFASGIANAQFVQLPTMELSATGTILNDDHLAEWRGADFEIQFTAKLNKPSGLVIGNYVGSLSGISAPAQALIIGLNGAGNLAVYEATGPGAFIETVIDATADHSLASKTYRVKISSAYLISAFIDGVAATSTRGITNAAQAGLIGMWRNDGGGAPLQITNISRIWR